MTGLLATFEKPTTKDFVWPCKWALDLGPVHFCANFVLLAVLLAFVSFLLFFFFALRKPKVVPGKLQLLAELGVEFVKENIALQMIGPEGIVFMALLCTLFFYIFFGNIFEVIPLVNFSMNSRIAFPIVLATIAWVTYNTVGIRHHGFFGYLKMVMFPPGVPIALVPLIALIEFISTIVIRPITLSVRLFANMVAGHFLLAVFFLGTIALFTSVNKILILFGVFSGAMAIVLVGFEIFVSVLQAFIFAVLTASYIGGAAASEH